MIDIGNSRVKIALFSGNMLLENRIFEELTADQLGQLIVEFEAAYPDNGPIIASIIATVRTYPESIKELLKSRVKFLELSSSLPLPIKIKYRTPETLGHDRIALAVGSTGIFPTQNVLIIDAGTCITYDLVSSLGEYYGGAISPGIVMRYKALHTFTDKLPLVNCFDEAALIGDSTESSIRSGVMNGVLAEMDGIIDKYRKVFPKLKIIITGGDANYFDKNLKNNIFANSNVVLSGLNMILNYNVGN